MLSKIQITNRQGSVLVLPFNDVDNGLIVEEIKGLDPTKATLVSSSVAGQDGAQYYSSKREPRNLVITLGLEADYVNTSVKSLRQRLYNYFMPKTQVTLRLYEDLGSYVDIVGIIESFESPLFTQEPEATISIQCFDPDFFDPNSFTVSGLSVSGTTTMTNVPYLGSVESGFLFIMNLDRNTTGFSVIHQVPNGDTYTLDFYPPTTLLAGDRITISTIAGAKGATLRRANVDSSLLYAVSPTSKWLELEPGVGNNLVRVSSSAAGIPWSIQYVNRYGGL